MKKGPLRVMTGLGLGILTRELLYIFRGEYHISGPIAADFKVLQITVDSFVDNIATYPQNLVVTYPLHQIPLKLVVVMEKRVFTGG